MDEEWVKCSSRFVTVPRENSVRLEIESACVEFYKAKRSVRTPSSEQVRQPIFRTGLDQWRNYEPWLGQLKNDLGDALGR